MLLIPFLLIVWVGAAVAMTVSRLSRRPTDRRQALYRQGRCVEGGYDIRANPHRCPECGAELFPQAREYWRERFGTGRQG